MDERLGRLANHLLQCPSAAAFDPLNLDRDLWPLLYVLDILTIAGTEERGLRVRLTGTAIDTLFGRNLVGERLDRFLHGPHSAQVLAGFQHCATARASVWMRQVVAIGNKAPRFVEGILIYLVPDRIYGGLMSGEGVAMAGGFEMRLLNRDRDSGGAAKVDR
jgi:hypothetical protein